MIKLYWKQAWGMLKEEKLFSSLYIAGTCLAVTMTMIFAILYYIRLAPVYPENGRNKTLVIKGAVLSSEGGKKTSSGLISYNLLNEWLYPLKDAEAVTGIYSAWGMESFVQPADGSEGIPVVIKYTDENFFRVFTFVWTEGKSFTNADRLSGIRNAVLSESYAKRLFGTAQGIVGKHFMLDFTDTKIVGVVKDASYLTPVSFGQVYLPYTCADGYEKGRKWALGSFMAYIKVSKSSDADRIKKEVNELVRKYNASSKEKTKLSLAGQPEMYWESFFHKWTNKEIDWAEVIGEFAGVFLALLFVPALNLSGMIAARMRRRSPEMGIRKAFGAKRSTLLNQIIWENLLLTFLGAFLGLLLAWVILGLSGNALFSLLDKYPEVLPEGVSVWYGVDMLFAPAVFLGALLFCVLLNLLSALIPAWSSLRKDIVCSINEKN